MLKKLIQNIALKWVKNNAVPLVAYGLSFLVENFVKVQPALTHWANETASDIWKSLIAINSDFGKFATEEEVNAFIQFLQETMYKLSKQLNNFSKKGNQA